ncbi:MAG: tetratricopeptide repeat protein [Elusimicrobiales bacterium]|nr:tetratricopeptide repeat protein [Elusimicrobiales bacterium]
MKRKIFVKDDCKYESSDKKSSKLLSDSPRACLAYGDALYGAGKINKAIFFYEKAVKLKPAFIQSRINLSIAYAKKGLISKAQKNIKHVIKLDSGISHTYLILGKLYVQEEKLNEAVKALETAIELSPDFIEAYYALMEVLIKLNDKKKLARAIKKCSKLKPDKERLSLILYGARKRAKEDRGNLFLNTNALVSKNFNKPHNEMLMDIALSGDKNMEKRKKIIQVYHDIGMFYRDRAEEKKMKAAFLKFSAMTSKSKTYDIRHFRAYCAVGEYANAFKALEKIMNSNAITIDELCNPFVGTMSKGFMKKQLVLIRDAKVPPKLKIFKIFYQASLNPDTSYEDLKKLNSLFVGKYAWMKYLLAAKECNYGNYAQSLKLMRTIKKVRLKDWVLNCAMGEILLCAGKKQEAFKQFDRAYGASGKNSNVKAWKGECYLFIGQYEKAIKELNIAVEDNNYIAYTWRGAAHLKLGMYKEALEDLNKAVKLAPSDLEAYIWRGESHRILKNFKLSLKDFNYVIKKNKSYFWAYFNRALIKSALKNYKAMERDFKKINNNKLIFILKKRLGLKLFDKPKYGEIARILTEGLKLAKGNRQCDGYLLKIAFPEYENI